MTKEQYVLLYEKHTLGICTEEEKKLFEQYSDEFSLDNAQWDEDNLGDEKQVLERMYKRFHDEIHPRHQLSWFNRHKFSAAAAILIMLGIGVYLSINQSPKTNSASTDVAIQKKNIPPGGKKAVLTLQDGSQIILDNSQNGIVANQANTVITKTKDGQVIYNSSQSSTLDPKSVPYNSISTPRGGEYQLLLPDNTKVWLNAESTIKFPAVFCGNERKIELSGEAYFEVAQNKEMPFKVLVEGTEIEVLGTHFNVNGYNDRADVNTTLLEGSVKLKNSKKEVMLKPGQSGISSATGGMKVKNVDVEDAVAWKNGYFVFQDEDIYSIMAKAARWYDVDVEFRGNMKDKGFFGKVNRYDNISELLKNMELTGEVQFKIEGRRVIVMAK
jgi:ferric-dicitrate binding protein FerR (iron transport regulator)